jgi:hypothetical protein
MVEVTINISLASGGDGSCRWVGGGGGGGWLAGRGGGGGGVKNTKFITHTWRLHGKCKRIRLDLG